MAKYSYEFKLKGVKEDLTGKGGYKYLAERNAISHNCILQNRVKAYQKLAYFSPVQYRLKCHAA